jgi:hypothetical protein
MGGVGLTDRDLFRELWWDALKGEILRERTEDHAVPQACPKYDRLWREYAITTRQYVKAFSNQQLAARDSAELARFTAILHEASQRLRLGRYADAEHRAAHHSVWVLQSQQLACIGCRVGDPEPSFDAIDRQAPVTSAAGKPRSTECGFPPCCAQNADSRRPDSAPK